VIGISLEKMCEEEVCAKEEEMVEFSTQRVLAKKACRSRLQACMTFPSPALHAGRGGESGIDRQGALRFEREKEEREILKQD